jgi:hypothetical protein
VQTIRIDGMKHPIVLVDSAAALDPESLAIQCVAGPGEGMTAYFYRNGSLFSAWDDTSMHASERVAFKIRRFDEDSKITHVTIGGVEYPVRSRSSLWNPATQSESYAPIGTVHWWLKGVDGEEYYKCDIHFAEGDDSSYSMEGIGKSLNEALQDLISLCQD